MNRLLSLLLLAFFLCAWAPTAQAQCGGPDANCCRVGPGCGPGLQCNGGKCRRPDPPANPICGVLGSACCANNSCAPGLDCNDGRCVAAAPAQVQPPCGGLRQGCCAADRSCGSGLTCKRRGDTNTCLMPSGGLCVADADCAPGTHCFGGRLLRGESLFVGRADAFSPRKRCRR